MDCFDEDALSWLHDSLWARVCQPYEGEHRLADILPAAVGPWRILNKKFHVQPLLPASDGGQSGILAGEQQLRRCMDLPPTCSLSMVMM